jgi:winged helix DNA-binding protein
VEGQALVHLLLLASHRGVIVRGPMIGPEQAFVLTRDWLGETKPIERDVALAELARRYLAGHGPATDRDLAYWSGLALRDARAGLKAIGSQVIERGDGVLSLKGRRSTRDRPPPRLLGSFDPLLFGWTSREPVLGAHGAAVVSGGVFRPFAIVDGRAAATWVIRSGGVEVEPFRPLSKRESTALDADAQDVLRFLKLRSKRRA